MNAATWILILVLAPTLVFIIWLVLLETSVKIDPGTIGLALLRGKSTGRTLTPGRHFIRPWRKVMIQTYPSRELALVAGGVQQANPDVDYLDEPVSVFLSDHALAEVSYTVRCQLIRAKVHDIHESYGPEGIWSVLRDVSRRTVIAEAAHSDTTIGECVRRRLRRTRAPRRGRADRGARRGGLRPADVQPAQRRSRPDR